MQHRAGSTVATVVAACLSCLAACGGTDDSPGQRTSDPNSIDEWSTNCESCDEPSSPDLRPDGEPREAEPNSSDFCSPRPPKFSAAPHPELPEHLSNKTCTQLERAGSRDEADRLADWRLTGDTAVKTVHADGEISSRVTYELRPDGDVASVEKYASDAHLPYERGEKRTEWTYDEAGRLLEYHRIATPIRGGEPDPDFQVDDPPKSTRVTQKWENGRLVRREARSNRFRSAPQTYTWEWEYREDGQLDVARFSSGEGRTGRVDWSYHRGRPVRATRRIDGEIVATQEWSFREDGSLERRRVEREPTPKSGPPLMDGLAAQRSEDRRYRYNRWRGVGVQAPRLKPAEKEGCERLPVGVGHGYDHDRPAYRTAWEGKLSRRRAGRAYGQAYVFSWYYGHAGMMHRPNYRYRSPYRYGADDSDVTATVHYDRANRMRRETVTFRPSESENPVTRSRLRTFEEDRLAADRMVEVRDDTKTTALLRFERDDDGRLQRRLLLRDGQVVSAQNFGWDDRGRWNRVVVEFPGKTRTGRNGDADGGDNREEDELEPYAALRREVDSNGRTTRVEFDRIDSDYEQVETWSYGDHGLVRHRRGGNGEFALREYWNRDAKGRVLRYRRVNESREEERREKTRTHRYSCTAGGSDNR